MEQISPSVWRKASRNTARKVSAVLIARDEYRSCPPRVVHGSAGQAAIAASVNHMARLPRPRRTALYSAQFVLRNRCSGTCWRQSVLTLTGKLRSAGGRRTVP
jgi:hypothetical protein